jgi:CRISPR-associated Cas5-like protein
MLAWCGKTLSIWHPRGLSFDPTCVLFLFTFGFWLIEGRAKAPFMSYGVRLKVWGDRACFTRPEMKVERVSYDVMTPSAARGILEAIHWKPAIRWVIDKIPCPETHSLPVHPPQ